MRTVTYKLDDLKNVVIHIGRAEENLATRVRIDAGKVFAEYPAAVPTMKVINPAGTVYGREVSRDGDLVIWDVTESDLAAEGQGEMQLTFTENSVIVKSANAQTEVCRSISGGTTPPDPVQDWIDRAEEVLEEVEDAFPEGGTTGQVLAKKSNADFDTEWVNQGSGGTTDYTELENKPQIGGVTLTGNKSLHDLGAAAESDIPDVSGFYTKPAGGIPASDIAEGVIPDPEDLIDDTAGEGDTDKTWSADKLTSDVLSAIQQVEDRISTDEFHDMTPDAVVNGKQVNLEGNQENSVNFEIRKYEVTAGDLLYLKIAKDYKYSATYQFQNNETIPTSNNPYIVGNTVTDAVDAEVTVPNGATWLMVSHYKPNTTNLVQKSVKVDAIPILINKVENLEEESYVQDHKDGNVVVFDNHIPDSVVSVTSKFAYDSNGITSASLFKTGKNIANVGRRSDLPSVSTKTYPGTVTGYGTTIIPIHGKPVVASIRYVVSDSTGRSLYVFYYDKNKTPISYVSVGVTGAERKSVLVPSGAEYVVLRADGVEGLTVEGQIEYGTELTEYEAFSGNEFTETFGATIYGGYLNWNTGVLTSTLASDGTDLVTPVVYELTENEIKSNSSVTIISADKGIVEASCAMGTAKKVEQIEQEIHPFGTVPGYWEEGSGYLTSKADAITTLARSCASNADIFYFVTDVHWTLNQKHTPAIIDWLNQRINVPRMFNGGDNADYFKDTAEVSRILRKVMNNGEYYMVDGNHEYLQNKTYDDNFYANREFADKAVYGDAERTYYYVDNPASKMRYIILSTYGTWNGGVETQRLDDADQKAWFANTALAVEDGWTVIVFVHIFSTYTETLITGTSAYISAMQAMEHGEVACIIQGDQHHDYTLYVANDTIPIVCSTCDKNRNVSAQTQDVEDYAERVTGTINEQAFDVVIVDKTNKDVHFVRIGYAKEGDEVRTVHYGGT